MDTLYIYTYTKAKNYETKLCSSDLQDITVFLFDNFLQRNTHKILVFLCS